MSPRPQSQGIVVTRVTAEEPHVRDMQPVIIMRPSTTSMNKNHIFNMKFFPRTGDFPVLRFDPVVRLIWR